MKATTRMISSKKFTRRLIPLVIASGAFAMLKPLQATMLNHVDREMLTHQASVGGGLMSVMVTLQDFAPEVVQSRGAASIRSEIEEEANGIHSVLGSDALKVGSWNNGMGQVGMLVTPQGLRLLEQSGLAKEIQPDHTRGLRDRAWMTPETQRTIEQALNGSGTVDVEIALHSDEQYHIGAHGDTVYQASSVISKQNGLAAGLLQKSDIGKVIQILEDGKSMSGASSVVRARIDWEAYYALRMSSEVRSLRVSGFKEESYWPEEVLESAFSQGDAEVIVTLQGGENYSPYQGYMSDKAWELQSRANEDAFHDILKDMGRGDGDIGQNHAGIGSFTVRLTADELSHLYEARDARIRSIELVKPVATPSLSNSTNQINMPPAWNAGYRGARQLVIVLDSGVAKNHEFFKNANGVSRISNEACFGTNDANYKSICPSANNLGDSPVGTVNSGMPYNDYNYCGRYSDMCSHGTHVAGIAAGRESRLTGYLSQGVAPDASIVAAQVFSYPRSSNSEAVAFNIDLLAALKEVHASTTSGIMNPYVVNMSLGGGLYGGTCDSENSSFALAVANLHSRGVPVIAATGNSGSTSGISFPACISKVIKVSSVNNDRSGTVRPSYANIAPPGNYDGPIFLAPGGNGFSDSVDSASAVGPTIMTRMSGTSMAAPHVAGFYAAIKSGEPGASVANITALISSTASIAAPQALSSGTYGFRRIRSPL